MSFQVLDTVTNWNDVRTFLMSRKDVLSDFGLYTVDPEPTAWKAQDKTTFLYLDGLISKDEAKNHIHLSCNIVGGVWVGFHVTQIENNLHLGSYRVVELDQDSDEYNFTGRMLKCQSDRSIETEGKHSKMKISVKEQKKVEKIRAEGGTISSPGKDMTILVNAMVDAGIAWI